MILHIAIVQHEQKDCCGKEWLRIDLIRLTDGQAIGLLTTHWNNECFRSDRSSIITIRNQNSDAKLRQSVAETTKNHDIYKR